MKKMVTTRKLLWLVCIVMLVANSCKKSTVENVTPPVSEGFRQEKNWIQKNGGSYKDETLAFKAPDGKVSSAKLDWSKVKRFSIGMTIYTEVPFSFSSTGLIAPDQERQIAFSMMLREVNNKMEAAIKVTQYNAKLGTQSGGLSGTLETFSDLNGKWINSWFRDSKTGRLMKGSDPSVTTDQRISINSTGDKKRVNQTQCGYFIVDYYSFRCWQTGGPHNDTACGWLYSGTVVLVFCYDDGGGTGGGTGGGGGNSYPPSGATPTPPSGAIPCPGDVIKDPKVAASKKGNVNGGRFGQTRTGQDHQPKWHKGLDIYAVPNTPIYAAFGGTVSRVEGSLPTTFYGSPASFGNLVEIQTTLPNGQVIKTLYAHLNAVEAALLTTGATVQQGQQIGLSGRTGNAQKGYSPHVHVQITENGVKKDPEPYLSTKFDSSGNSTGNPCP